VRHARTEPHQAHHVRCAADVGVDADGHERAAAQYACEQVEELVGSCYEELGVSMPPEGVRVGRGSGEACK
jgi:hypothetical protein